MMSNERLYEGRELGRNIYFVSLSCLSVTTDFLSWKKNQIDLQLREFYDEPLYTVDTIIVLGCVYDVNSVLRKITELHEKFSHAQIFVGGCMARDFSVDLPDYVGRLNTLRCMYTRLEHMRIDGFPNIDFYPLKIGAGNCLCGISDKVRGACYETVTMAQRHEFLRYHNTLLVSDNPTELQVTAWCGMALDIEKAISFYNISHDVINSCIEDLLDLASYGFLNVLRCPAIDKAGETTKNMQALAHLGVKILYYNNV